MEKRGGMAGIFNENSDFFRKLPISAEAANTLINKNFNRNFADEEIELAERENISILTLEDEEYPALLKEIHDAPPVLYVKGGTGCLNNICIGLVGSRKCSKSAEIFTHKLSGELAAVGITVVSGFAYGVDIAAHRGACEKGATAAVLGSGILKIYPDRHIKYIDKILDKGGCLISEFSLNAFSAPSNFPRRNRIISGLSKGIAVIEAGFRSGSLITARLAAEQNRDVFAVPAFPLNHNSATNKLLRDGAKLLESSLDIIAEFQYELKTELEKTDNDGGVKGYEPADETEKAIYEALRIEPMTLNEICDKLSIGIVSAITAVSSMELSGAVLKDENDKFIVLN